MPFTVHTDGSITCATAEDALKLQALILEKKAPARKTGIIASAMAQAAMLPFDRPGPGREFLSRFAPYEGSTLDSEAMANVLAVEKSNGVGVKLRHMRALLEKEGIDLDRYLVPVRQDNAPHWKVQVSSFEKSE